MYAVSSIHAYIVTGELNSYTRVSRVAVGLRARRRRACELCGAPRFSLVSPAPASAPAASIDSTASAVHSAMREHEPIWMEKACCMMLCASLLSTSAGTPAASQRDTMLSGAHSSSGTKTARSRFARATSEAPGLG